MFNDLTRRTRTSLSKLDPIKIQHHRICVANTGTYAHLDANAMTGQKDVCI